MPVNWCEELGTVLSNDEVIDGKSERGGYPVVQKKMKQWCLRVSAYAQRLLDGLDTLQWTDSLKETQRNWIGRSEGTEVEFNVKDSDKHFTIFTTRADTMFGVTFMVLAPESELVPELTTPEQKEEVEAYLAATKKRTERERQFQSGLAIMCWLVMERVQLWQFLLTIAVTMLLPSISICQLFHLWKVAMSLSKATTLKRALFVIRQNRESLRTSTSA